MKISIASIKPTLLSIFLVIAPQVLAAADSDWDYPSGAGRGISEMRAGKAGQFRSFSLTTTDPIEKVVLWYAEKLRVPKGHGLLEAARKGFANIKNDRSIRTGIGHDTEDRQDHTVIVATLTPKISHVTFLHRPDLGGRKDVTISVTTSSGVTSIILIMPVHGDFRKK